MCPAEGGAYSHRRSRYFGRYRHKTVDYIAEIEAVVDVRSANDAEILWANGGETSTSYKKRAITNALRFRPNGLPLRVFLLGDGHTTDFVKDTKGGMQGSKKYLDVSKFRVNGAAQLAAKLHGKTWSEFSF